MVDDSDAPKDPGRPRRGLTGWLAPLARPAARPPANGSGRAEDEETRRAVLNLDPLERKIGLAGAAFGGVIALTLALPHVLNPKAKVAVPAKGTTCPVGFTFQKVAKDCLGMYPRSHWVWELAVLLVFALAIFVTVRIGRRGPVGFTLLMAGLAFEAEVGLLGFPFIIAGGWLLIRAWRVQRYGSPTATKSNPSGEKRPPPVRSERPSGSKKAKAPERTGPVASKRYTPKTPKKKRTAASPPES